jgi:hypothetical protein
MMKWLEESLKRDNSIAKDGKKLQAVLECPPGLIRERQRSR